MRIKSTKVTYAFSVQHFENATIVAYMGLRVKQVDILISKNQALQIYLKHHDNVYKTP